MINLINDQALARIKRTISYLYMDYLLSNCKNSSHSKIEYRIAKQYVDRFRALDEYLKELADLPESKSMVQCNSEINLCELLYRGDAFNELPIIGIVDGTLLEDRDEEVKHFDLTLHMKLNGKVTRSTTNSTVSKYHLHKLIQTSDELGRNKEWKQLKIYFLYSFLMVGLDDENYDPRQKWEQNKKRIESEGLETVIEEFYNEHKGDDSSINVAVKALERIFSALIAYKVPTLRSKTKVYTTNLLLDKGGLLEDVEGTEILKTYKHFNEHLKHVSVVEDMTPCADTLLNLPIDITIESISLYEKGQKEHCDMTYDIDNMHILPVVFYPNDPNGMPSELEKALKNINSTYHIRIPYRLIKKYCSGPDAILYVITYITCVYILLDKVLRKVVPIEKRKEYYIPILRAHSKKLKEREELGEFVRDVGKTLEHLLSVEYCSNSQGFEFDKDGNPKYVYNNAVTSLYSRLPRRFYPNCPYNLNKVAVLIVTSRKADAAWQVDDERSLILGEVVLFTAMQDDSVKCESYKTFSDYYSKDKIYSNPEILNDIIQDIYNKGYHKIIYIAKAPYTSKLNITSDMKAMYFMSEDVIETMRQNKPELIIYPLYFELFSAYDYESKDSKGHNTDALYVSDTQELDEKLINSKYIAGVLNVYSGNAVALDKQTNRFYRSVMIYSTLCNMYDDKVFNAKVAKGLIDNSKIKKDIVDTLMMLHYARYEATYNVNIKINPYKRIIGDDSVAARSVYEYEVPVRGYAKPKILRFNMLAYLTDLKKIIDGVYTNE